MKSPPAHRVLAASHKYMSLYGLSGTLKRWNKAHKGNQVWFIFPDESKSFYTVLKEAKARAVCVALGFCAGRLSSFVTSGERGKESKRKQAPSGRKCRGLRGWEQLCGGCVQKDTTSLCWLFRKYRLLTQISQLGGLGKAMVYLSPASTISQVNLQVSSSFSLGGVTGSCAHANRFFCDVCSTPCIVGIIVCFIPCDYPAWEKSVWIYSLWNNLLFSYFCSVAYAP